MLSSDESSAADAPLPLARHRVETPETYETWREYAFSSDQDTDGELVLAVEAP